MTAATALAFASSPLRQPRSPAAVLILPIVIVNAVGFIVPVINLAVMSVQHIEATGAMTGGWSLEKWHDVATDDYYWSLLTGSLWTSFVITLLTLIVSYPIALFLHRATGTLKTVLLVAVISPLLLSSVVRTYGWIAILSDKGLVNSALLAIGMHEPLKLMFNLTGVMIGMTEILMPYMVLAILSGLGRLDPRVEEAALTLGATPFRTFLRVVLPLSIPGIAFGSLLTFVLAISSFITPKLLGGGRVFLLATEIYDQAIVSLDWPLAATLSIVVLVVFGLALALYTRALKAIG
jgi:putative spermidine/putrescine transport system permease protein